MKNLIEGLFDEMNRVREIITEYKELPGGAGKFAATVMEIEIQNAENAIKQGDVIKMLQCYHSLTEYKL